MRHLLNVLNNWLIFWWPILVAGLWPAGLVLGILYALGGL